jgi:hypothetical protein
MINTEITVTPGHGFIGLFDVADRSERRAGRQIIFESIQRVAVTLGNNLDAAIGQVAHGAMHLVPRGGAQREETIAYALHKAGDNKATSDHSVIQAGKKEAST